VTVLLEDLDDVELVFGNTCAKPSALSISLTSFADA